MYVCMYSNSLQVVSVYKVFEKKVKMSWPCDCLHAGKLQKIEEVQASRMRPSSLRG